ncbi:hypothetical protein GXW74_02680 [Roseomonas eburnea]|uniref:Uncharacterized protein n=1 Tax=Neoroseomonas eburnea TaxID=1346889 RepID=A0A9X9X6P3_9PROT|nr:hypothetical protein [Neoroseomonas eburnea]MBR0679379.1 hypothetical protein [Neoroseomonas eburnea]
MGQILSFGRFAQPWPDRAAGLDAATDFVLMTCLRPWVAAVRDKLDPLPAVLTAIAEAGGPEEAGLSAHALMHGVAMQAVRVVDVGCPHCARLTGDEALLLYAVTEAAFGVDHPAEALAAFMHEPALAYLDPPLIGLARRLDAAGWRFRRRRRPEGRAPDLH